MRNRGLASMRPLAVILAASCLASVSVIGQGPTAATKTPAAGATATYTPPRTPDGQPDIQGLYKPVAMFPTEGRRPDAVRAPRDKRADTGAGPEHWYEVPNSSIPMVVDPPNGIVPYQPWARALNDEIGKHQGDNPEVTIKREYLDHRVRCLPSGVPRVTTPCAYCGTQIIQGPGYVAFFYEWNHLYTKVPLDGRPHIDPAIKLWMGDSRGRWEGNTLVVDTTNFNDKTWVARGVMIHTSALHVVERYTPIDRDTIDYEATIEDRGVFTKPWKLHFPAFTRYPAGQELFEYACIEGNHIDATVFGEQR